MSHRVSAERFTMACFSIREARQQDIEDVFRMVKEFAEYEKKADQVMITAVDFKRDWNNHLFHVFVAELKTEGNDVERQPLVGYVLYYYTYNSWYGQACVMDDFYVADEWRRKGMGCALFSALMQRALDKGCAFVNWTVLKRNKLGIDFYLRRGARDIREEEGRTEFRMTKEAMERVVAECPPRV